MPRRNDGRVHQIAAARRAQIAAAPHPTKRAQYQVIVIALDREDAIRIAKTKSWWPRCLNPDYPVHERSHFVFTVAGGV